MNQPHNEDDIEAYYGEMYDGDMNEEFDEENTKFHKVKIQPFHQEIKIHPYHQPLNIHPYPC